MNSPDSSRDIYIKQEEPEDHTHLKEERRSPSLVQEEPGPPQIKQEQEEAEVWTVMSPHRKTRWNNTLSDSLNLPVCKEEVSPEGEEGSPSLVKEEPPEPPHVKEEQEEELLQRPEEVDGPMLTSLAVKSEGDDDDDDDGENRETEPVAGSSTERVKTPADVEDSGTSQPTSDDQLLSSDCSDSDVTEDSDDWEEETGADRSPSNAPKSHKAQRRAEGQRSPSSDNASQPFICSICSKGYSRLFNLNKHIQTHTGEKPFVCPFCSKGYGQRTDLKKHMKIHTGEKPFVCSVCSKSYAENSYLKKHMKTHTGLKPFVCSVCSKGFGQKGYLKTHMRIHTGERGGTCTVCSKSFGDSDNLKSHMRTHTRVLNSP